MEMSYTSGSHPSGEFNSSYLFTIEATVEKTAVELPKPNFFSNPEVISHDEILECLDSKSLDMCWQFGEHSCFHFVSKKNEIYFEVFFDKLPDSYDELTEHFFIKQTVDSDGKEQKQYIFSYEWKFGERPILNHPRKQEQNFSANTPSYLVDKRRIFEQSTPRPITEDEIVSIICNHNVLFYTGAGLSAASSVPSMNQLYDLLGLKEGVEFASSLKHPIEDPQKFAETLLLFHNACFFSPPTEAHEALKQLALFKNTKVITENLDCLHEYSGISPYRINPQHLREEVGSSPLSHIDYIICIGLSYDDRGFLGWYKNSNPEGKIISVDLGSPSYLGDEDFIIHADLQHLIPSLATQALKSN